MKNETAGHSMVRPLLRGAALVFGLVVACNPTGGGEVRNGGQTSLGGQGAGGGAAGGTTTIGGSASGGSTTAPSATGGNASGGNMATGGTIASGSGGTPGTGGTSTAGTTGGATARGGAVTGGAGIGGAGTGGATGTAGTRDAGVDMRQAPDTGATGGAATGGSLGTGGVQGTGGSVDRCDLGVYDPASPPRVLSLSGNLGTHDPVAIEANGTYYLYATGLSAKTSTNLTAWNAAPSPIGTPAWMRDRVPGVSGLWAPDISFFNGKYHLYYSGSTFGSNRSCIGHATRESMSSGSWVESGAPTICSNVDTSDNWNAIDPNVVIDAEGKPWLALGSFWSGLKIAPLDADGNRAGTTITAIANHSAGIEAPFIVRRCGYYYLFMSWDKCCEGANSTYNIRVARSASITGPYTDKAGTAATQGGGTLMTKGDDTWAAAGHQGVMIVGKKAYLLYHAYARSNGASTLRLADLVWDESGWPIPVGP